MATADPPPGRDAPGEDHRHGHRHRLRDRFARAGREALEDYELLELLLFRSIPQRDVKPLAKELLARFGSVTVLNGHIHQTLQKVEGHLAFHSGRSTAFPQPPPGVGKPGPMREVAEADLRKMLGINRVSLVQGTAPLAVVATPLEG